MSRTEIVLLYESTEERAAFEEARDILSQMGISFREETLPSQPMLSALKNVVDAIGNSACIWAAGRSAYLLPVLAASLTNQQPLVVLPCPKDDISLFYLESIFDLVRGYPIAFTRPHDAQAAALLAVHSLAGRHPSYADLLHAYLHKRHLQPV
ncbi:MAG: AIR carboxylase family protein [Bacteroidia bacterium]|nr:AIR carboxylase family protein [Bacteroidia bacterium]